MKIIFVNGNESYIEDVIEAIDTLGHEIMLIPAPPSDDSEQESYLNELSALVDEFKPDLFISMDYIPFISLFCRLSETAYHSWIVSPDSHDLYDESVLSPFTKLFFTDKILFEKFEKLGLKNINYLPYGCPRKYTDNHFMFAKENKGTIMLWGNCNLRTDLSDNLFNGTYSLLDSTQGYLEGIIACKCLQFDSTMALSSLPDYVKNDILSNVHYSNGQSFEIFDHFIESVHFNPVLTSTDRAVNYSKYQFQSQFKKLFHINFGSQKLGEEYETLEECLPFSDLSSLISKSPLHILLPSRNRTSGLSPLMWVLLGSGACLLYPSKYATELKSISQFLFNNMTEMLSKSAYFNAHLEERNEIVAKIQIEILEQHLLEYRIPILLAH